MIRQFSDFASRYPEERTVTVVFDIARYNSSRQLKMWLDQPGRRLRLDDLQPNVLWCNLIERFWDLANKISDLQQKIKLSLFYLDETSMISSSTLQLWCASSRADSASSNNPQSGRVPRRVVSTLQFIAGD